ncbi:hypothetical protein GGI03_008395 [Coemansia sp. RSA 2337]|nr:hypothetical protein GGH13_004173 [Coemansia sp. S155-1]KAJ2441419.1 hypothetical protein GGI03_008395 [Coemansia sp. RSA 2337]
MHVEEPADVKREAVVPAPNDDSDMEGEESADDADFDMYGKGFSDEDDQNMENAEPTVDDQDMEDNSVQIVVYAQVLDPASVEARAESLGRPIRRLGRPRPAITATSTLPLNPEHPVAGAMPVFNSGNVQFGNDPITGALPFDLLFPGFAPNPVAIDDLNNSFNDLFAAIPAPPTTTGTVPVVPIQDTTAGGNAGGDATVPIGGEEVDNLLDWYINLDDETFAQIQANLRASGFNFEGEQ